MRQTLTFAFCILLLGICLLGLLLVTLTPFVIVWPSPEKLLAAISPSSLAIEPPYLATVMERLPFMVVAGLLVLLMPPTLRPRRILTSIVVVALLAAGLEITQLFVLDRHARWSDLLIATALGSAGATATGFLAPRIGLWQSRGAGLGLAGCFVLLAGWIVVDARQQKSLRHWDCGAGFHIANEADGTRPWFGRLSALSIATPSLQEGRTVDLLDRLPQEPPLLITSPAHFTPNLETRRSLCTRIVEAGAFEIEATITPSGRELHGPARIFSWSTGIYDQNVLIGEDDGAIVFRFRQGLEDRNGRRLEMRARLPETTEPVRIRAGFQDGHSWLSLSPGGHAERHLDRNFYLSHGRLLPRLPVVFLALIAGAMSVFLLWKPVSPRKS